MEPSTPRPVTLPPSFGLLTPPTTGGFSGRKSFPEQQEPLVSFTRLSKSEIQGEDLDRFFEDYDEGSSVNSEDDSSDSQLSLDSSSIATGNEGSRGASSISNVSHAPVRTALSTQHISSVCGSRSTTTYVALEDFPFMELPISVRNKVYKHLLVVPAIICVRQKHTAFHDEKKAFLYAERRELLPGIAYALTQTKVDGFKSRLSRFDGKNLNILRVSREVFNEARSVMYGCNEFDIVKPANELAPEPSFSTPLFPPGYQRIVAKLNIRIRTFYDMHWLLSGGYNVIRNHYRGLSTLTLILEIDSAAKGFGRQWARKKSEKWVTYITRLQSALAGHLFDGTGSPNKTIPTCLNLRVLFSGEAYTGSSHAWTDAPGTATTDSMENQQTRREELRSALVETWELFKKGGQ